MKSIFFTPGPSQLFKTCKNHMQSAIGRGICSISHRGDAFHEMYGITDSSLRKLLGIPREYHMFFLSSATAAMESTIGSLVMRHSFHLVNGAFSEFFGNTSKMLGKSIQIHKARDGNGFDIAEISVPRKVEMICLTHNETSTGVLLQTEFLKQIHLAHPDKLLALDIVSSVPCVSVDIRLFDCVLFSVQKGFGMPAGLGVLIISPRALEIARYIEKKDMFISYNRIVNLHAYAQKHETPQTPNVLGLYLLGRISDDFLRIGPETIQQQTSDKAKLLYSFFDKHSRFTPFVRNPSDRSPTIIVINTNGKTDTVVQNLKKQGYIVGKGYKQYRDTQIRIANFPAHTTEDIKLLLSVIT